MVHEGHFDEAVPNRLLLTEGDDLRRSALEPVLVREGFQTTSAPDGTEAVQSLGTPPAALPMSSIVHPVEPRVASEEDVLQGRTRLALLLLAVLYPAFHVVDHVVVPHIVQEALAIRLGIGASAVICLLPLRLLQTRTALTAFSFSTLLAAGLGMVAMASMDSGFASTFDAGVLMCLFGASFMPWSGWVGGAYGFVLTAAYIGVNGGVHGWSGAVMPSAVLLGSAIVVGFAQQARFEQRRQGRDAALRLRRALDAERRVRQAESELLERDTRLVAVGMKTSALAHDLRNQLQSAMLFNELASESVVDDQVGQDLALVAVSLRRAIADLQDVVAYSRGGDGQLSLAQIDLEEFLSDVLPPLRTKAARHGVQLRTHGNGSGSFWADQRQLARAVENLVHNAIEAVEPTGGHVDVSASLDAQRLVVEVRDDGPGIPEEDRADLFEPFMTRKKQGTGLGLATVRNVAHAHEGDVAIAEGPGAVFRLNIARHPSTPFVQNLPDVSDPRR
jgi:signal transduction histidine kinase